MINKNKIFLIGADSGGTLLRIRILFPYSKKSINQNFKSIHLNTYGVKFYCDYISKIFNDILKERKLTWKSCEGICLAVAGARTNKIKSEIKSTIKKIFNIDNIFIISDAEALIASAFNESDGAIIIAGTGSVIYIKYRNKLFHTGGWGRIIGDAGSGFEIGKIILQKLTAEYDFYGGKAKSKYLMEIEKKFGLGSNNIIEKIYHKNFNIASLAQFVIELANKGEKNCRQLLKSQAEKLIQQLNAVLKLRQVSTKLDIALAGGLLENENYYSKLIKQKIKIRFKNELNLLEKKFSSIEGAVNLAFKKFINIKNIE